MPFAVIIIVHNERNLAQSWTNKVFLKTKLEKFIFKVDLETESTLDKNENLDPSNWFRLKIVLTFSLIYWLGKQEFWLRKAGNSSSSFSSFLKNWILDFFKWSKPDKFESILLWVCLLLEILRLKFNES